MHVSTTVYHEAHVLTTNDGQQVKFGLDIIVWVVRAMSS
jgi:hypothetical protein